MILSMTGFGSATGEFPGGQAAITVRSVNHRYLDVTVSTPRGLAALEPRLKQLVQSRLARGRVELAVRASFDPGAGSRVAAAKGLIAGLIAELRALKAEHGLAGDVTPGDLARFPGALEVVEVEGPDAGVAEAVLEVAARAVSGLVEMRCQEGARLLSALREMLRVVEEGASRVEERWQAEAESRRGALATRVRELVGELGLEEGRLYQEVVRLVDRSDVAEELQRLRSHVSEARDRIERGGACGKSLDFLAQELMREANTVGSKSASAGITQLVVGLKAEIERFREQVQNVE
jgi:uncharacterized protein (TIGR00255 family)